MKIKLSEDQKKTFKDIIEQTPAGQVALKKVADMLDLLKTLENKSDEIEVSKSQFDEIYRIANHPNLAWAVNEENADMHTQLEEIKADLKENQKQPEPSAKAHPEKQSLDTGKE